VVFLGEKRKVLTKGKKSYEGRFAKEEIPPWACWD